MSNTNVNQNEVDQGTAPQLGIINNSNINPEFQRGLYRKVHKYNP